MQRDGLFHLHAFAPRMQSAVVQLVAQFFLLLDTRCGSNNNEPARWEWLLKFIPTKMVKLGMVCGIVVPTQHMLHLSLGETRRDLARSGSTP